VATHPSVRPLDRGTSTCAGVATFARSSRHCRSRPHGRSGDVCGCPRASRRAGGRNRDRDHSRGGGGRLRGLARRADGSLGHRRRLGRRRRSLAGGFLGGGRRRDRRRRRRVGRPGRRAFGQEEQRIEVSLRVVGPPNPEMDVRHVVLGLATRPDGADVLGLADGVAAPNGDRPEMRQRHRQTVRGLNRQALAADGDASGIRDRSGSRRGHVCARGCADVDAPMLTRRIGVATEHERLEHRPVDRPRPRSGRRRRDECQDDDQDRDEPHPQTSVVRIANESRT
jgi:hypothetical protein